MDNSETIGERLTICIYFFKSFKGLTESPKVTHKANANTFYGTTILSYSRTSIRIDPGTLKRGLEAKLVENRLLEEQATKDNEESNTTERQTSTGIY